MNRELRSWCEHCENKIPVCPECKSNKDVVEFQQNVSGPGGKLYKIESWLCEDCSTTFLVYDQLNLNGGFEIKYADKGPEEAP